MVKDRPEERFAFEIMRRTLGVDIEKHDDNSRPRMVDGHFTFPDGREGAVEITTAVQQEWMETESLVSKTKIVIPGLQWAWDVWVGADVRIPELEHHLSVLLPECEHVGAVRPDYLRPMPHLTDSYTWYFTHEIDIAAWPETNHPGKIYLVPGLGGGGAVPDALDGFPAWLEQQLAADRFASDLAKLAASGRTERHLFLRVHDKWWPFEYQYLIAWKDVLPTEPFSPPGGLTGVWLATRQKNPILYWTADDGWARSRAYD